MFKAFDERLHPATATAINKIAIEVLLPMSKPFAMSASHNLDL